LESDGTGLSAYDVVVVGAGPAGCAAAITAAKNGTRVLVLERGRFPRHKVCGEFVSAESLELLAALLRRADRSLITAAPPISESRIFVDRAVIHADIAPAAASITRFDLDAALWRSCAEQGIDARDESPVQAIEGTGPFLVKTRTETFESEALINATGRWSNLTSAGVRAATNGDRWVGVKAHFWESHPPSSVDLYFFDGGYCGVQPVGRESKGWGAVNACAMVNARVATCLADVLRLHPRLRERSRDWGSLFTPVSTSPLLFHEPEPVNHGMLQVGDAAMFVDPFIGDGISLALRSGALAAESLAPLFAGVWGPEKARSEYRQQYRKRLSHVFRISSTLRRALSWPRVIRRPALALLNRAPALRRRLVSMTR
jgi:flavin-dependent dehydrogenase